MSRLRLVSDTLQEIADLVEQADRLLSESIASASTEVPQRKGLELHKRDMMSRLERRLREKIAPLTRNVLRARRERKARSRYATLNQVSAPPRKVFSSRLRNR